MGNILFLSVRFVRLLLCVQNLRFTDASEKLRTRSVRSFLDPLLGKKKKENVTVKPGRGQKPETSVSSPTSLIPLRFHRDRGVRLAGDEIDRGVRLAGDETTVTGG